MNARFPLSQKVLALVLVPLVISSGLLLVLAFFLAQAEIQANRESHAREMRGQCTIVLDYANAIVSALVNFKLTRDRDYLRTVSDAKKNLVPEETRLQELVKSSPEQSQSVQTISLLTDRILKVATDTINGQEPGEPELSKIWQAADQIKIEIRRLNLYETRASAKVPLSEQNFRERMKQVLVYGSALNFVVAILLCLFAVRQVLARLLVVKENYKRFAEQDSLLAPSSGNDEIADIDQGFHDMARTILEYVRKEKAMIENANDIICSLDASRHFLRVNRACTRILGYEASEICGHEIDEFLAENDNEKVLSTVDQIINTKASGDFETVVCSKDKQIKIFLWTAYWSEQEQALFCVLHDITELRRLERTKQGFMAMVSHDLRAPLMSVHATLELLEDSLFGPLNDSGKKAVASSQRNLLYLLQFVEQILDIERMESGNLSLSCMEREIGPALLRARQLVTDLADKLSIKLQFPETDKSAYFDEDRIIQVLVNLLGNALKYAPAGSSVTLDLLHSSDYVEFRISDKGRGIPAGMETIIFDRFQQVNITDWKEKKGSGLGLAICKLIVEAHKGSIGVDSEEGKGSTFWFKIPARAVSP